MLYSIKYFSTYQTHSAMQSQKVVFAYFTSKQILPFCFQPQYNILSLRVNDTAWLKSGQRLTSYPSIVWALGRWWTEPDQGAVYLVDVWTKQDPKVKRPHDSLWSGSQGQTYAWLSCDKDPKVKRALYSAVTRISRSNVHMTQLWPIFQGQTSTWLSCDQDPKVKRSHDSVVTKIPRSNVHMTQLRPGSQGQTSTWLSCDQDPKVKRPHDSALTRIPRSNVHTTHLWPGSQG